ncbi:hypothetical protein ACFYT4_34590 [Streptomyces sp. NPDC004609]|uniref:hypothetical protein n=1 Tax=Streptomyces sp. NPDC004609 TaxID=3364704 RepID=UPI0036BB344E
MTGRRTTGQRGAGDARAAAETIAGWAVLVLVPAVLAFETWIVMLVIGAVHGVAASVPAFGYGTTVLITLGLDLAAFTAVRFLRG